MTFSLSPIRPASAQPPDASRLHAAARALEATFLAEMLRHAGVGDAREGLGGGAGEAAFAGFLADAYGDALAARGGVGLSEYLFRAIAGREGGE